MQANPIRPRHLALIFALVSLWAAVAAPASFAARPQFKLYTPTPESVKAGEHLQLGVAIDNVGDEQTTAPVTLSYTTGPGLSPPRPEERGLWGTSSELYFPVVEPICQTVGSTMTCTFEGTWLPGVQRSIIVGVTVGGETTGTVTSSVSVSGGDAAEVVSATPAMTVGPPGPFGFTESAADLREADGSQAMQAGADPADFTTSLGFRSFSSKLFGVLAVTASVQHFKDVTDHLPEGLIGNPTAIPAICTTGELAVFQESKIPSCPTDSQVGVTQVYLSGFHGVNVIMVPLYNMVPPPGSATELGFNVLGVIIPLDAQVRPGDHGIDIVSRNTSTTAPILGVRITVWGVPADHSHDRYRGECLASSDQGPNGNVCPTHAPRKAFLRMPTSCSGEPLAFGAESNSYENPDVFSGASFATPALSGCDLVPFAPGISVDPTGTSANSPTGVSVRVSLQQNSNPDGLAEADLKKAVVKLPEGMAINPSAADGLQACTDVQLRLGEDGPSECPDGSKLGTLSLHTPLLENPIEGLIYLRTQNSNDPESGQMYRIAIELRDDPHGIDIKVPGYISVNKITGQLTTTFDNNPQLPFSDISLSFKAGARAPLVTPASCEPQTTEADLYSWAEPDIPVHRAMTFDLTSGPEGSACPPPPFNPRFNAGVSSVQAGGFTPFLTTFTRKDADQSMQRVSVKLPLGVSGSLTGLPLCPEAQASTGTCGQASEIGSVTAGAGAGPTPFYVTGGRVFMTGPYEGAPFGLSIVVPAKAGPFDLGNVNVRARVEVDPHTAQLTVTSDPLPQIVGGVPVNLRLVNVTVNRPGFTFNPTNCDALSVIGTMTGGQGAVATVANHFQVTNCGALAFRPVFKVSTAGKTSRRNGAGLDVKLTYPKDGFGKDSNIARVKVSLPKQLPSRLETLQQACPAATFQANPAACPSASRVGTATATTPIIPVPLSGPVYFVSHGGDAFPDLTIVLQGYGVTVDLIGSTFINEKTSVTSTTFKQIPDVPVGTFELKLPQGRYSALAANGNLCQAKLKMPTAFIAQDGAEIHQSTPITTTGCARHKAKRAKARPKHGKRG